jgi:hypothetical protein
MSICPAICRKKKIKPILKPRSRGNRRRKSNHLR